MHREAPDGATVPTELMATGAQAAPAHAADVDALTPGTVLGRYRIGTLLGRGGMGEVYRAEQLQPVHRTVALKLLRNRRLDARQLAWFEVERQVLAQMQHPAIAQIFDAGTLPDGTPFFAMELIEGVPLTRWCDEHRMTLAQRIELMARTCDGVAHAHAKGVVHRDLKPGNVLVTEVDGRPQPKIIDFGIAMAQRRVAGEGAADRAGTPAYMSPEQAAPGSGVADARSDVYSLGVMLCELLTDTRPPAASSTDPALSATRTTLQPPSAALESRGQEVLARVATGRGLRSARILRLLRHELDWVVLKAVRHDPADRYASVTELAQDLRRFLAHRPAQAVPQTRRYLAAKFARRHRVALATGAAVVVALVLGLALSLWGWMEAREQRRIAEARQAELEQVAAFQQDMLEGVDVAAMGRALAIAEQRQRARLGLAEDERSAAERVSARVNWTDIARETMEQQILQRALLAVDQRFRSQPLLAADLRASVARVLGSLGAAAAAAEAWRPVVAARDQLLGAGDVATLRARRELAQALIGAAALDAAALVLAEAAPALEGLQAADPERLLLELLHARLAFERGDLQGAAEAMQALLGRASAALGAEHDIVMDIRLHLSGVLLRLAQVEQGRAHLEAILAHRIAREGEASPATQQVMSSLAKARGMAGDFDGSLELAGRLIAALSERLGAEHPLTLGEINTRVVTLIRSGREAEASAELDRLVESATRVFGAEHPTTLRFLQNQASTAARLGDHGRAVVLQRALFERRRRALGPEHPDVLRSHVSLATILADAGRPREALPIAESGCTAMLASVGEGHPDGAGCLHVLGDIALRAGDAARARAWLERAVPARAAAEGAQHVHTLESALRLAAAYRALEDTAALEALRGERFAPFLALPEADLDPGQRAVREQVRESMR